MDLSTKIAISNFGFNQNINDSYILVGSCFSENIGEKLLRHKQIVETNPFGILFNPLSIYKALSDIINRRVYEDEDLIYFNDQYLSLNHHSSFSNSNKEDCLMQINDSINKAYNAIKTSNQLIITFGSAFYYKFKASNTIVANCHKIPQKSFDKEKVDAIEIVEKFTEIINQLSSLNKNLKVVFTVSPVRHWKDGAENNQWSKSILIDAVNRLKSEHSSVFYFPAYEIMMDELRDYRFYANDMLHPSSLAIDIIWERFKMSVYSEKAQNELKEIEKIVKSFEHKPFDSDSESHLKFEQKLMELIEQKNWNDLFAKELIGISK